MHTSAVIRRGVCLPTRGWPPEQMYPIMVRVSLVTGLTVPLCAHPAAFSTPGLKPRITADPLAAVWPGRPRWYCSWATSGVAGLSWRLLLYSLCCFRHYLWLTWRNIAVVQGEAVILCWISELSFGPERRRLGILCLFGLQSCLLNLFILL